MKVKELIENLEKTDGEFEVGIFWDSAIRSDVDGIYVQEINGKKLLVINAEGYYSPKPHHQVIYEGEKKND